MPPSQTPDKTPDKAGDKPAGKAAGRPAARQAAASRARQATGARGGPGRGQGAGRKPGRHRLSAAERAAEKRRRLLRNLTIAIVAVVVVGGIGGLVAARNLSQRAAIRELNVQTLPSQGQTHLNSGGKYTAYNSTPPTSGPHDPNPAPCGVTTTPIPNEVQVHDLEHGVVMVQYRPDLDPAQVRQLEELGRTYTSHVIVAPYPGLGTAVAATAWTKLMNLDSADTGKVRRFIDLYRQKGPEAIGCPVGR